MRLLYVYSTMHGSLGCSQLFRLLGIGQWPSCQGLIDFVQDFNVFFILRHQTERQPVLFHPELGLLKLGRITATLVTTVRACPARSVLSLTQAFRREWLVPLPLGVALI